MEHLTSLDAGFLAAEDSDRHVSLAVGGLAVLEGPMPDHESLMSTLAQRIGACPRFTQRLRRRPFDLGPPEWVDDVDFDLSHHVRRIALPSPGNDQELFGAVAHVMSRRLDRNRPLWEIWVIEGLTDDRWAMLMKVHHCIADGIATAHMFGGLCDGGGGNSFVGRLRATRGSEPPRFGLIGAGLKPVTWMSGLWSTSATVATAATHVARGAAELAAGLIRPAGSSPLNGSLSGLRCYGATRVALDDIRQVCRAFDVTVNDVALAALTESYRALLIRRGEQPRPDSLRTLVPVSMRSTEAFDTIDNRISVMLPYLPVDEENAIQRLRMVHARLSRSKATGQHQAGNAFVSAANAMPFALTAWALRLLTRLPQRGVATLTTNVPGPQRPLKIMGRTVTDVMAVPPIAMRLRTGVAMLSYADQLFFGILADFNAVPDVDELARGVEIAVARLVASSRRRKPSRDRRGLALVVNT